MGDAGRENLGTAYERPLADPLAGQREPSATSMIDLHILACLHPRQNVTVEVVSRVRIRRMLLGPTARERN